MAGLTPEEVTALSFLADYPELPAQKRSKVLAHLKDLKGAAKRVKPDGSQKAAKKRPAR